MPKSTAIYDVKPVESIPEHISKSRTGKFESLLEPLRSNPGALHQIAVYKNEYGAANRRTALRKDDKFSGFSFEARTVEASQYGGTNGTWSVLFATYNG